MKYAVAELIKQINDELEKDANNGMRSKGITMAQFGMLFNLYESESGKLSMKELETRLHVAQSTAAGIASRLEAKGLIESSGSSEDKRIKIVSITAQGKKLCGNCEIHMNEAEEHLLHALSDDERETLSELLLKVRKSL